MGKNKIGKNEYAALWEFVFDRIEDSTAHLVEDVRSIEPRNNTCYFAEDLNVDTLDWLHAQLIDHYTGIGKYSINRLSRVKAYIAEARLKKHRPQLDPDYYPKIFRTYSKFNSSNTLRDFGTGRLGHMLDRAIFIKTLPSAVMFKPSPALESGCIVIIGSKSDIDMTVRSRGFRISEGYVRENSDRSDLHLSVFPGNIMAEEEYEIDLDPAGEIARDVATRAVRMTNAGATFVTEVDNPFVQSGGGSGARSGATGAVKNAAADLEIPERATALGKKVAYKTGLMTNRNEYNNNTIYSAFIGFSVPGANTTSFSGDEGFFSGSLLAIEIGKLIDGHRGVGGSNQGSTSTAPAATSTGSSTQGSSAASSSFSSYSSS